MLSPGRSLKHRWQVAAYAKTEDSQAWNPSLHSSAPTRAFRSRRSVLVIGFSFRWYSFILGEPEAVAVQAFLEFRVGGVPEVCVCEEQVVGAVFFGE